MVKSLVIYSAIFLGLFMLSFNLHHLVIENRQLTLSFSLRKVYLFHTLFSLLICINFKVFSNVDKIFPQLGFIYLGTLLLKIMLFSIIFYTSIFTEGNLSKIERVSMLIPALIFLFTEAYFVAKILIKKEA
jgi:hypothetical protein